MNRISIALILNQALIVVLAFLLSLVEGGFEKSFALDLFVRLGECVVYFVSFVVPVILFNKMNKNAEREIYEPVESEKASPFKSFIILGFSLGAITLAAYLNYYIVNAFLDYSDFTNEYFWSVELDHTYQMVIYFAYSAIIPAFVEELLFRGTVCRVLTVYGKGTAVVASAALFALMHANIEQLIYTFIAGLLLGWIYVETKNLAFPILLHFLNNGISSLGDILYEAADTKIYNTYTSYSEMIMWAIMLLSLVVLLVGILKKGSVIGKLKMKPDENGNEVAPLTVSERVSGFFSLGTVLFTLYSIFMMVYYIYLSTKL